MTFHRRALIVLIPALLVATACRSTDPVEVVDPAPPTPTSAPPTGAPPVDDPPLDSPTGAPTSGPTPPPPIPTAIPQPTMPAPTPTPSPSPSAPPRPTAPPSPTPRPDGEDAPRPDRMYAATFAFSSQLWHVAPGDDQLVGEVNLNGTGIELTDIARLDADRLIAIGFEHAYLIDPASAEATLLGRLGPGNVNALALSPDGVVYAANTAGEIMTVDPATGQASIFGGYGGGYRSSGDLAFGPDRRLYATVKHLDSQSELLVTVDLRTGRVNDILTELPRDVFGLGWSDGVLYGFATSLDTGCFQGALLDLTIPGEVVTVRCTAFFPGGATAGAPLSPNQLR